jgi:hypothetical protein
MTNDRKAELFEELLNLISEYIGNDEELYESLIGIGMTDMEIFEEGL